MSKQDCLLHCFTAHDAKTRDTFLEKDDPAGRNNPGPGDHMLVCAKLASCSGCFALQSQAESVVCHPGRFARQQHCCSVLHHSADLLETPFVTLHESWFLTLRKSETSNRGSEFGWSEQVLVQLESN